MRFIRQQYAGAKRVTAIAIYQALTEIASDLGSSTQLEAPIKKIGEYAGASETTVKRYLHEFEELGLVEKRAQVVDGSVNLPNRYFLVTPSDASRLNRSEPPGSTGGPTPGSADGPTPSVEATSPNTPLGEEKSNNKAREEGEESVVALKAFGISGRVAEELANRYPTGQIREKIAQTNYLLQRMSPLVAKNPAGYLRRAIEEDYVPPAGFPPKMKLSAAPDQRETDPNSEQELAATQARRIRQEQREQVLQLAGEHAQEQIWRDTFELVRQTTSPLIHSWLNGAVLVDTGGQEALVVLPTKYAAEWAQRKLRDLLSQALSGTVGTARMVSFTDYASFLETQPPVVSEASAPNSLHSPPMLEESPVGGQPASKEIATGSSVALPQRSGE